MPTDSTYPSAIGAKTKQMEPNGRADDGLPPQRHVGLVGPDPDYPSGPSLDDQFGGLVEEIKGKIFGKPEVVEHGRERRTGELTRKERERDNAADPLKTPRPEEK